jgi:ribosomal protein RSM22 (predicted rRNA methylase)
MAELPPALRASLERELSGASRRDLAQRTAATTQAYRAGRGSAGVIRGREDALAYALARMPATYAACAAAFRAATHVAPTFRPRTLLDAGCGPGAGSWAAREAWPSIADVAWLEASAPFLDLAVRLADGAFTADAMRGDLTGGSLPSAELVLASYALAEIPKALQGEVVNRLWAATSGVLALVEPGTPAGFARLLEARAALIAQGAAVLAPCPHAAACPLTAPDWCHFSVRLPRSRDHRLAKGAEVAFEDEKFAYLLVARPHVAAEPRTARVLARPKAGKPGIELKLCDTSGTLERRFVARRDKAAHAQARRLDWGDAL